MGRRNGWSRKVLKQGHNRDLGEAARMPMALEQNGMEREVSGWRDSRWVRCREYVRSCGVLVTIRTWFITLEYGENPL